MPVVQDLFSLRYLCFNKDWKSVKDEHLEKKRDKLNYLKEFVGDRPFIMGYLTILDFLLSEALYYFENLFPGERKNYEFLWRIRSNFEAIPEVKAY